MNIKKDERLSDHGGGTAVASRTKRQKNFIDWGFLISPRKKRKTCDVKSEDEIASSLSHGAVPTEQKPPEENLQPKIEVQDEHFNVDRTDPFSVERFDVTRLDNVEEDRRSESTLSAISDEEQYSGAVLDHCYAMRPVHNNRTTLEPKKKPVGTRRACRPTVDLATLAVYRALIDHTYSSITPSNLIDAVMLKHHYICTIQDLEFQEDYSWRSSYVEEEPHFESRTHQASNSRPHPDSYSIRDVNGTFPNKLGEPKKDKDVLPAKQKTALPQEPPPPPVDSLPESSKVRKKTESTKRSARIKLEKRETSLKSPKVSAKKTGKLSAKKITVSLTQRVKADEKVEPPPVPTKSEDQKVKSKKRRKRNQTGWPTKYKAQQKKSTTSVGKMATKDVKRRSPKKDGKVKKSTKKSRDSNEETSMKEIKVEKDVESRVNVSIEEAVKRRHHTHNDVPSSPEKRILRSAIRISENKSKQLNKHNKETVESQLRSPGGSKKTSGEKNLQGKRKVKSSSLRSENESPQLIKQEKETVESQLRSPGGSKKTSGEKNLQGKRKVKSSSLRSENESPQLIKQEKGPVDDAETSNRSLDSKVGRPASSSRKSGVPPDADVTRSTRSSSPSAKQSTASTNGTTKGAKSPSKGRSTSPMESVLSPRKSKSKSSTAQLNRTTRSRSSSSTNLNSPEKSSSVKHPESKARPRDRSPVSEKKKRSKVKTIKSEDVKTEDALEAGEDLSNICDTAESLVPKSKGRIRLRTKLKLQVTSLFNSGSPSKSKSSRSQHQKPVKIVQKVVEERQLSDSNADSGTLTVKLERQDETDERPSPPTKTKGRRTKSASPTSLTSREPSSESSSVGNKTYDKTPDTSSGITDCKNDEIPKISPDDENRRAELGMAVIKVEPMDPELVAEEPNSGECQENDVDEMKCRASTSNEVLGMSKHEDSQLDARGSETGRDLLCTEEFNCDSDSYSNDNEGGKYVSTTEPELVCPPLENLDYTDWKNTKTICTTDVSDSELDETRSTGQCSEALGASEEDEDDLKSKILRVIGCSDDVEPVNPTAECDDSSTLRLLRRYSSRSCQTDEQSLAPGHSEPAELCGSKSKEEPKEEPLPLEVVGCSDETPANESCDPKPAKPVVDEVTSSSCEPQTSTVDSNDRETAPSQPEPTKQTSGVDTASCTRKEIEDNQVDWDARLRVRRDKHRKLKHKRQEFRMKFKKLGAMRKLTLRSAARFLQGCVGMCSASRRYESLSPRKSAKDDNRSYPSDLLCDRTYFGGVVDLTKSQAVGGSSGVKGRPIFRVTPAILRRRPGKEVRKKKLDKEGRCLSPSKSAKGKNRPVSDFLCDQRRSHVFDLTESQGVDENCTGVKARLTSTERPVIRHGEEFGKQKVDEHGRCFSTLNFAEGNNGPPVSDLWCDRRRSHVNRRPGKEVGQPEVGERGGVLSMNKFGTPQPLLPNPEFGHTGFETLQEDGLGVLRGVVTDCNNAVQPHELDGGEPSSTSTDSQEVAEMCLECTEDLSDNDTTVGVRSLVEGTRPIKDVRHQSPVSPNPAFTPKTEIVTDCATNQSADGDDSVESDPPVLEHAYEPDVEYAHQHPPYLISKYIDLEALNQHPPVHESAFKNDADSKGTYKMDSVGTRTTTLRDRALKESHQISVEHAYCLKSWPIQSYVIGERANVIPEKLITKSFPLVMKNKPVTVRVLKTPFPRGVEPSTVQTRRSITSDQFDLSGIVRPLPTIETDAVARVDDATSNAANQDEWKMKRYQPPPEIARLYVLVQKRLGLAWSKVPNTLNKDGRPPFSYQTLAAMAIESDPLMAARATDILDFMQKHFPFYRSITSKWWKQNVRSMLCSSRILRSDRVGHHVYYSFRKELLLPGDPVMYEMVDQEDEGLQQGAQSQDDDCEWNDSPPDLNSCYPQEKLLAPKVESAEPPELDPLIPICSYSDEESNGFPVIVNAETYTLDQLPPHAEPECDREIKEESDDGSSPEADTSSSSPDGKRVYACQYCPAVFNTLQGNLDHSVIHPEVMKPCPLCDFSSPDAVQLLWHMNSTHHNDD